MKEILSLDDKVRIAGLVESGVFSRLFESIKQEQTNKLFKTETDEQQKREEIYYTIKGVEELEGMLQQCINDTEEDT